MIQIENLHKSFEETPVIIDLSLRLEQGQSLSILGKSGCGKTTLLKILSGLVEADAGRFLFDGQNLLDMESSRRQVVYLSQEPLLFPHLNVFENLAYGLRIRKEKPAVLREKVEELGKQLELSEHLTKKPEQLSGGQRQRVSFGRALIIRPRMMLLDEPFGSLDAQARAEMQDLFNRIRKEASITALFVTHDAKEAISMGDGLALLDQGQLKQYRNLDEFIQDPRSGVKQEIEFWRALGRDV